VGRVLINVCIITAFLFVGKGFISWREEFGSRRHRLHLVEGNFYRVVLYSLYCIVVLELSFLVFGEFRQELFDA